jgi:hypothetical protein
MTLLTIILDTAVATMTLDINVGFHTVVTFVIPLVSLMESSPLVWSKERLWNFNVILQRMFFYFVIYYVLILN